MLKVHKRKMVREKERRIIRSLLLFDKYVVHADGTNELVWTSIYADVRSTGFGPHAMCNVSTSDLIGVVLGPFL